MPNYLVSYNRDDLSYSLGVFAPDWKAAGDRVQERHPDAEIVSVSEQAKFLVPAQEPTWVNRRGGIQRLSTIALSNLLAIRRTLLDGGDSIRSTGLFAAVEKEIANLRNRSNQSEE